MFVDGTDKHIGVFLELINLLGTENPIKNVIFNLLTSDQKKKLVVLESQNVNV